MAHSKLETGFSHSGAQDTGLPGKGAEQQPVLRGTRGGQRECCHGNKGERKRQEKEWSGAVLGGNLKRLKRRLLHSKRDLSSATWCKLFPNPSFLEPWPNFFSPQAPGLLLCPVILPQGAAHIGLCTH